MHPLLASWENPMHSSQNSGSVWSRSQNEQFRLRGGLQLWRRSQKEQFWLRGVYGSGAGAKISHFGSAGVNGSRAEGVLFCFVFISLTPMYTINNFYQKTKNWKNTMKMLWGMTIFLFKNQLAPIAWDRSNTEYVLWVQMVTVQKKMLAKLAENFCHSQTFTV